jgi:multidrug efflux pump
MIESLSSAALSLMMAAWLIFMILTDIFIKRPVLASVISMFILFFGLASLKKLPIQQFPVINNTMISIATSYVGANAENIATFITRPLENAISSVDGIDYTSSESKQNQSTININLKPDADAQIVFNDIASKVQEVKNLLPRDAMSPNILKTSNNNTPIMYISLDSEKMLAQQIHAYAENTLKPQLQSLDGVAEAQVFGGQKYALRIFLDQDRMTALHISANEVAQALMQNNTLAAAGSVKSQNINIPIHASTDLKTLAEFKKIIVASRKNSNIYLDNIATIELGKESYDVSVKFNGKNAVFLAIKAAPLSNPINTIKNLRSSLAKIQTQLPQSLNVTIAYDATAYIKESIREVILTMFEAIIIVIAVIYLFLRSLRSVIIPALTLPLSLIGVLSFMSLMGYSLNFLTLLALVLAIGLVVDDAIVVVENIHRHLENGETRFTAAIKGAREIATPIIAMTLTLAAVYAPIGFMTGLTGALFKEFSFTLAGAVVISGIVALTLSPMLCAKLLSYRANTTSSKEYNNTSSRPRDFSAEFSAGSMDPAHKAREDGSFTLDDGSFTRDDGSFTRDDASREQYDANGNFKKLQLYYIKLLKSALSNKKHFLVFSIIIMGFIPYLYTHTATELAPTEDQGFFFIASMMPNTATLAYIESFTDEMHAMYTKITGEQFDFFINSPHGSFSGIILQPWSKRSITQSAILAELQNNLNSVPGLNSFAVIPPSLPGSGNDTALQLVIKTTDDFKQLFKNTNKLMLLLQKTGMFMYLNKNLNFNQPEYTLNIEREKASMLGFDMQTISQALQLSLSENYINFFSMDDQNYQVIASIQQKFRNSKNRLDEITLKNSKGQMVALANFTDINMHTMPNSITHFQGLNAATIQGIPKPGVSQNDMLESIKLLAPQVLPKNYTIDYAGELRQFLQNKNALLYVFFLSILVIYLVLAAQYESFKDPCIILVSVPMSICGALLPLNLGFASINIYTQIGLITLIGLISKHGILIVDFANQLQLAQGMNKHAAIIEAASMRLRPILMTSAAMICGVLPLLYANGAGALARYNIGLVITVGLAIGTIFTLFIVPVMYIYISADKGITT